MKMFKRSLALMFAVLLCCMTVFAVSANGEDNDVVDDWDGPVEEEEFYNGDFDKDGDVDLVDLGTFDKYFLDAITADDFAFELADIDGSGDVGLVDLGILDKYFLDALTADEIADYNLPAIQ